MENVPQVHGEQNIKDFGEWITFLDSLGYVSKWQDLNAKDYGIPQNRERCFMVSYLDKSLKFAFPSPVELTKTAKDYLEDSVDNKYYLKTERAEDLIKKLILDSDNENIRIKANTDSGYIEVENGGLCSLMYPNSKSRRGRAQSLPRLCPTIAVDGYISKIDRCIKVGELDESYELASRVDSANGVSPAITTHEAYIPKFLEYKTVVDLSTTEPRARQLINCLSTAQRGIIKHQAESTGVLEFTEGAKSRGFLNYKRIDSVKENIAKTITSRDYKGFGTGFETQNGVIEHKGYTYRIRKLTPLECFRLMDVTDEEAKKMLAVNSEQQCYKQAGNSIVVSVMSAIFNNLLLGGSEKEQRQLDIFDIL